MDSRRKLKRFLADLAQGQGPDLPAIAKLALRGLLPRILGDVDDADPAALDATMLEVAKGALGLRSDEARSYELVPLFEYANGGPDQDARSESHGEPRTETTPYQPPDTSELEERIMEYLRSDIAQNGGSGRRLPKILLEVGAFDDEGKFSIAIRRLESAGRIELDMIDDLGWIYAIPR